MVTLKWEKINEGGETISQKKRRKGKTELNIKERERQTDRQT